jgi:hypothetical protein
MKFAIYDGEAARHLVETDEASALGFITVCEYFGGVSRALDGTVFGTLSDAKLLPTLTDFDAATG